MDRDSDPRVPRRGTVYPWLVFNPSGNYETVATTEVNEAIANRHAEHIACVLLLEEVVARVKWREERYLKDDISSVSWR